MIFLLAASSTSPRMILRYSGEASTLARTCSWRAWIILVDCSSSTKLSRSNEAPESSLTKRICQNWIIPVNNHQTFFRKDLLNHYFTFLYMCSLEHLFYCNHVTLKSNIQLWCKLSQILIQIFGINDIDGPNKCKHSPIWVLVNGEYWISNVILNDINTMLCPIQVDSNTIELTVHTCCYYVFDLLCVK